VNVETKGKTLKNIPTHSLILPPFRFLRGEQRYENRGSNKNREEFAGCPSNEWNFDEARESRSLVNPKHLRLTGLFRLGAHTRTYCQRGCRHS